MKSVTFEKAINYCKNLYFANHADWRLPTVEELESLIDRTQANPALPDEHPFSNTRHDWYWTASIYTYGTNYVWGISMDDGCVDYNLKSHHFYVWPVRAGLYDEYNKLIKLPCDLKTRFIDLRDGTIKDRKTGLIWIQSI